MEIRMESLELDSQITTTPNEEVWVFFFNKFGLLKLVLSDLTI